MGFVKHYSGHIITSGKGRSVTSFGVTVVDTGESDQSEKEEWIRYPAQLNPRTTRNNQPALAALEWEVEM